MQALARCPQCRDRGWIVQLSPESAGHAVRCSCGAGGPGRDLEERARIPERYRGCSLQKFAVVGGGDTAGRLQLEAARRACQRYLDDFLESGGGYVESGLLFVGPPGVGKTHLAVAVLRELMALYGVRGLFIDFTTLILDIQSSFDRDSPESKAKILDPVQRADVLVLDELGAQKPTPFVSETLYLIINERYKRKRPTLFTTNYELGASRRAAGAEDLDRGADRDVLSLIQRIGPMLVSRLHEMANIVELGNVDDFRQDVKSREHHWA